MPIYMKVPGVVGTGTGKHKGWIILDSCQLGVNRHISSPTGGSEARNPAVSEIVVTKNLDMATTNLCKMSLWGEPRNVTIDFVKDTKKVTNQAAPYVSIELENTLITSYSVSGAGGGSNVRTMETLSLNFTKITYSTTPSSASTDPDAVKGKALWNLAVGTSAK